MAWTSCGRVANRPPMYYVESSGVCKSKQHRLSKFDDTRVGVPARFWAWIIPWQTILDNAWIYFRAAKTILEYYPLPFVKKYRFQTKRHSDNASGKELTTSYMVKRSALPRPCVLTPVKWHTLVPQNSLSYFELGPLCDHPEQIRLYLPYGSAFMNMHSYSFLSSSSPDVKVKSLPKNIVAASRGRKFVAKVSRTMIKQLRIGSQNDATPNVWSTSGHLRCSQCTQGIPKGAARNDTKYFCVDSNTKLWRKSPKMMLYRCLRNLRHLRRLCRRYELQRIVGEHIKVMARLLREN